MALVIYDTENLEPPILTVEEAVARSSFFEVPPSMAPGQVGDFSKGMAEAHHKILNAEVLMKNFYIFTVSCSPENYQASINKNLYQFHLPEPG